SHFLLNSNSFIIRFDGFGWCAHAKAPCDSGDGDDSTDDNVSNKQAIRIEKWSRIASNAKINYIKNASSKDCRTDREGGDIDYLVLDTGSGKSDTSH
ncbi:hypothetical protein AGABI2DRAFT_192999, partial [Agaricus bisporus var. bisporus H97]|uniref:hypothetical protein n=1 Tax=Agaricus bisporus var. bisporus (strain H97 / ATCC MYA-4626 / FGSC 10389) TaxID=936046 RepID=UPI00029F641E